MHSMTIHWNGDGGLVCNEGSSPPPVAGTRLDYPCFPLAPRQVPMSHRQVRQIESGLRTVHGVFVLCKMHFLAPPWFRLNEKDLTLSRVVYFFLGPCGECGEKKKSDNKFDPGRGVGSLFFFFFFLSRVGYCTTYEVAPSASQQE